MLRSRGNRQQRPSESSDEQQGRGGYYGGYPSSSTAGGAGGVGVGIASGADDYYGYNSKGGGRYGGGYGGSTNKPNNHRNVWDKKSIGPTIKGNPKSNKGGFNSVGSLLLSHLLSIVVILTLAMGGATLHYRRMIDRMEHELAVVKRRGKYDRFHHRQEDATDDNDNNNNNNNDESRTTYPVDPQELITLREKRSELQNENGRLTGSIKSLENELRGLEAQMKSLKENEIPGYETQITSMNQNLQKSDAQARGYREQFKSAHKSGNSAIVPGGPGHALNQRRELDKMTSLEDYEDYVQRREDALWDKIELLVGRLGKENRREAEEWYVYYYYY